MKQKKYHKVITSLAIILLTTFTIPVFAKSPVYTSFFSNTALSGYDAVAYFTDKKPVKGNEAFSTKYMGVKWNFSSKAHLEAFKAAPEKYAPQYGGYCALAVAHNSTAKGDPKYWTIVNGKLYLNYNAEIQQKWLSNKEQLIKKANSYWPSVSK